MLDRRDTESTLDVIEDEDVVGAGRADHETRPLATQGQRPVCLAELRRQPVHGFRVVAVGGVGVDPLERQPREIRNGLEDVGFVGAHVDQDIAKVAARGLLHDPLGAGHHFRADDARFDQPAAEVTTLGLGHRGIGNPEVRQGAGRLLLVLPHRWVLLSVCV